MGKTTKIVWNGCDNYVEADQAVQRGQNFDGDKLYHGSREFMAFEAIEVDPPTFPKDDDGEPEVDGVLGSESGKFYRQYVAQPITNDAIHMCPRCGFAGAGWLDGGETCPECKLVQ